MLLKVPARHRERVGREIRRIDRGVGKNERGENGQ